ncbi:MAG: DUF5673 domain-containing protein [Patescibacteria group bacterium]|nr:DUF5673 domain-containing protein [Patescibacteria group bacterium]
MSDNNVEKNISADQPDYGETLMAWEFYEFIKHDRSRFWYFGAGLIAMLLILFAFLASNILFGFIVIIASLIILMFHRSDNKIKFQIMEDGILVNTKFYEYKSLKNFYLIYEPPEVKTLYFEPKSMFSPRIPITIEDQDPNEIRKILTKYLSEDLDRENEPTSDQLSRMLKL